MLLVVLRSRPQRMGLVAAPRRARAAAPSSLRLPPRGSTNVAQVMRLGLHLGGGRNIAVILLISYGHEQQRQRI